MLKWKIGCLGPQRSRLPWATQQITNDRRTFCVTDYCSKFGYVRSLGLFEIWVCSQFGFVRSLGLFDFNDSGFW